MAPRSLRIGAFGLGALSAFGQAPAAVPAFEVASIKPHVSVPTMVIAPGFRNGTLHGQSVTLRQLLAAAYGMPEPRVIGPDWLDKNRFDIVGKSPEGVPDSELKPMLQTLLQDRFRLRSHQETREMSVYYLRVAKGGVKMPAYPAPDPGPERPSDDPAARGFPVMRGTFTTSRLAEVMARVVNRPVIDQTGLTERYNLFLSYAPLSPPADGHAPELGPPDFFTAVQKQLGLRLDPGRDNVEVVVIDHGEQMPTEN
jgi:uncharacterized protein (TIGR03435 family)